MESKIIKQEKNPFLEREEIVIEVISEIAPSSENVKAIVGKDAGLTIVKNIRGYFGKKVFVAEVVVYDNAEAKRKIETISQKVRKKMVVEKKAEEEAKKKAEEEAKKAEEEAKKAEEEAKKAEEEAKKAEEEAKKAEEEAKATEDETPTEEVKEDVETVEEKK